MGSDKETCHPLIVLTCILLSLICKLFRLELHLEKAEEGQWPEIVQGDKRGELLADPEEVARIHERLAHLTSDTWVSAVNYFVFCQSDTVRRCRNVTL